MSEAAQVPAVYVPQQLEPAKEFLTDHMGDIAAMVDVMIPEDQREAFAGRLVRIALHAMERSQVSDKLARCTPQSVFLAVANAAALGLEPMGVLGEGALIPYGTTCTFQPMYRGLIALATRGGEVLKIEARVWYEGDDFERQYGTDPRIDHVPCPAKERGKLIGSYAVAWLANGERIFEVCDEDEIAAIEKKAKGTDRADSPWNPKSGFRPEMYRKSSVKRLGKYLPLRRREDAFALRRAMAYDDAVQMGRVIPVSEIDPTAPEVDAIVEARTDAKKETMKESLREARAAAEDAGPAPEPPKEKVKAGPTPEEIRARIRDKIAARRPENSDGWSQEILGDLCQTRFSMIEELLDENGRVQVLELSVPQLEEVETMLAEVEMAVEGGEEVQLLSRRKVGEAYTLGGAR